MGFSGFSGFFEFSGFLDFLDFWIFWMFRMFWMFWCALGAHPRRTGWKSPLAAPFFSQSDEGKSVYKTWRLSAGTNPPLSSLPATKPLLPTSKSFRKLSADLLHSGHGTSREGASAGLLLDGTLQKQTPTTPHPQAVRPRGWACIFDGQP